MTTYYVGIGGNNANNGTTWALRKLTLNGAEDIPVAAGDTVYVGPGTYRELLTVDVSGSAGNIISYIGDYTGANTTGTKGIVRICGADADTSTGTRANCIASNAKDYRTFQGFLMDATSNLVVNCTSASHWLIDECMLISATANGIITNTGATQADFIVQNSVLAGRTNWGIQFTHSSAVDNCAHVVQNCIFMNGISIGVRSDRIGGTTVKNSTFLACTGHGCRVNTALTAGQTMTVNNNIFEYCVTAVSSATLGDLVENYNTFHNNGTDRTSVNTGANSITYPWHPDSRWFFEAVNGGTLVTPFDLASFAALIELNDGTGATSTDLRGTSVQGTYREWGALEYNSALSVAGAVGGGGTVNPLRGKLG